MVALAFLTLAGESQAGSIAAEFDHVEGAVGEPFVLSVTIEGDRQGDAMVPQVDGLEIRQQGMSQSTAYTNGQRSSQLQLTLLVLAERPGDFTIPSITAQVDGQKVATVPLHLKIHAAGQGGNTAQQQPQQQQQGGGGAAGGQGQAQGQGQAPGKGNGKGQETGGVYIERECADTAPYEGQQVICTVRVFHRGNLNGGQRVSQSTPDFRRFNVDGEKGERHYQKVINGQRYTVIELKEIVIPTRAGSLDLPPYTIDARVLVWNRRGNPLDKFFDNFGGGVFNFDLNFTEERQVTLQSEATKFNVKALPATGKPANFSGLVGNFSLQAAVSKNKVKAGDTVTITITISGAGIADTLGDIAPPFDQIGKVYPDKPEYTEQVTADQGINSKRVYKLAVVPNKAGTFPLGDVQVPIFNPKLGEYVLLKSDLGRLIVEPAQAEQAPLVVGGTGVAGALQSDVKVLNNDILGPQREANLLSQQTITKTQQIILIATAALPLSAMLASLGFIGYLHQRELNPEERRRSRAFRAFKEAMTKVEVSLTAGHVEAALAEAYRLLRAYLGDKLNLQGTALAAREISEHTGRLDGDADAKAQLAEIVRMLEQVEFGGQVPDLDRATQLLQNLVAVVGRLEK